VPVGRICNVVVHHATVILASSSSAAAPMLSGHLPPQVMMTALILIPTPPTSTRPNVAIAVTAGGPPKSLGRVSLVADVKAVGAQQTATRIESREN
jgi:hypothetical protein